METALLICLGLLVGLGIAGLVFFVSRPKAPAGDPQADARMAELQRLQGETTVHVKSMGDMLAGRQAELARVVNERLDAVTQRLGLSMQSTTQQTTENLQKLNERLAVIDNAQKNITDLASQVTSLQSVLANKQSRGAFGQGRMEAIVQDSLPKDAYAFQHTLSNRTRPDCCISMPDQRYLIIDAKFPLEGITAYREAKTDDERKAAGQRLRTDVSKHVADIAEKYLIPGETQEQALMFVPSESVYADLYDGFDDLVQKAYRARIVMVSPSLLMLAIQVVRQIQKDARMREATDLIRNEVGHIINDVRMVSERVGKLQSHFGQTTKDMDDILKATARLEKRGERIRDVEFGSETAAAETNVIPAPIRKLGAGE